MNVAARSKGYNHIEDCVKKIKEKAQAVMKRKMEILDKIKETENVVAQRDPISYAHYSHP